MALLDISSLPVGHQLRVRRSVLDITQGELARLLGTYPERICEAERESRYASPRKIADLQAQIDGALKPLELERGLVTA